MDIREFVEVVKSSAGGTYQVHSESYEWQIVAESFGAGYQVGIGNIAMIPLRRDGEDISDESLFDLVLEAVSDFYWTTRYNGTIERFLGCWVENHRDGGATLYIDNTTWVADQLSANITGAVLGEKEISAHSSLVHSPSSLDNVLQLTSCLTVLLRVHPKH